MLQYALGCALRSLEHIAGRDPERDDALSREPSIAPGVPGGMVIERMLFAIDFNGKPQALAIEVQNVGTYRMLAAKLKSMKPASLQFQP